MKFPRWISQVPAMNLREVGRNLYVGAVSSVDVFPEWAAVVDLAGTSMHTPSEYNRAHVFLRWPMVDGTSFSSGQLTAVYQVVRSGVRRGPVLIHCAAGLSRSVSAAYAVLRVSEGLSHDQALKRVKVHKDYPLPDTLASARAWVREVRKQILAPSL